MWQVRGSSGRLVGLGGCRQVKAEEQGQWGQGVVFSPVEM